MKFFTLFLAILLAPNCSTRKHTKSPLTPNTQASANSTEGLSLLGPPDAQASAFTLGNMEIPALFLNQYPGTEYPYTICLQNDPENCETGTLAWGSRLFPKLKPGTYIAKVKSCARASASDRQLHCGLESVVSLHAQSVPDSQRELAAMVESGVKISDQIRKLAVDLQTALQTYRQTVPSDSSRFFQSVDTLLNNGSNINAELLNSSLIPSLYLAVAGESPLSASKISSNKKEDAAISDLRKQLQDLKNAQSSKAGTSVGTVLIAVGVSTTIIGAIVTGVGFAGEAFSNEVAKIPDLDKIPNSVFQIAQNVLALPLGNAPYFNEEILDRKLGAKLDQEVIKKKVDDVTLYKNKEGEIKYFISDGAPYEVSIKIKSNNDDLLKIDEDTYQKLAGQAHQFDFEKVPDEPAYQLKKDFKEFYVKIGDAFYRKGTQMYGSVLPTLSRETHQDLADAWNRNPTDAYGKGVPLFDADGRLVEPPDHWKVKGVNWFTDAPPKGVVAAAASVAGGVIANLADAVVSFIAPSNPANEQPAHMEQHADGVAPQTPETLSEVQSEKSNLYRGVKKYGREFLLTEFEGANSKNFYYQWTDKVQSIPGVAGYIEPKAWNIHLILDGINVDVQAQVKAKLQVFAPEASNGSINKPSKAVRISSTTKKAGYGTMLAGLGGVVIGALAQLSLAANPAQEQLEKTLKVFDTKLSELHQQRLALALKVSEWLQKHDLAIPDPEWLSHL